MLDKTNLSTLLKNPDLLITQAYMSGKWVDAKSGEVIAEEGKKVTPHSLNDL